MNKIEVQPIPEIEADTRTLCEIRFDCLVTMHDSGFRTTEGGILGIGSKNLPPQWFRSRLGITLEEIKYGNEIELGVKLKQMYRELEQTIARYEQTR